MVQQYGAFGLPTIWTETTAAGTLMTIRLDDTVEIRGGRMICFVGDGTRTIARSLEAICRWPGRKPPSVEQLIRRAAPPTDAAVGQRQ